MFFCYNIARYTMSLEQKLNNYNNHFNFVENPEDFNFELSPERVVYKNEALRTKNRDLYASYLADKYPNQMERELADYDQKVNSVVQMSKDEVQAYMDEKGYNLLKADLSYSDQDSIFEFKKVSEDNLSWELENNNTDLLHANAQVGDAFFDEKPWIYVIKK